MDPVTMTNGILQIKAAVEQTHKWLTSVAEAVVDHAGALDASTADKGLMRGKLTAFERQLGEGQVNAEQKLTETFTKVDALIAQLRDDTTTTATALAAIAAQLEAGLVSLQSGTALPPGLPGATGEEKSSQTFQSWAPRCRCSARGL